MKALHVVQRYRPSPLTGSEQAMVLLSESLARTKRVEVTVLTSNVVHGEGFYDPRQAQHSAQTETLDGVKVVRLPVRWRLGSFYYLLNRLFPFLNRLTGGWLATAAFGPQLSGYEKAVLASKPELIHLTPMPMNHVFQGVQIARRHHIPVVVTPTMHFADERFNSPLIVKCLKQANMVITHTNYERKRLIGLGLKPEAVEVIPSSYLLEADYRLYSGSFRKDHDLAADTPIVLFIGSKSLDKGTLHLLQAWPAILAAVPQAVLVIAGSTTQSWNNRPEADLTGVIELDYVDDSLKQELLTQATIVAIPSRAESFGMILLEAWAKKKPFIGGPAGATRELIDEGKNGYTVEFGDVAGLAKRITELLKNPKQREVMGEAGQKMARQFTEKVIIEKTLKVYERAIAQISPWLKKAG